MMLKPVSVQRRFGEGVAVVVLTLGLVVLGVRYLPFPGLAVGSNNSVHGSRQISFSGFGIGCAYWASTKGENLFPEIPV